MHNDDITAPLTHPPVQGIEYKFFFKEEDEDESVLGCSWSRTPGFQQVTFAWWLTELGGATGAETKAETAEDVNSGLQT